MTEKKMSLETSEVTVDASPRINWSPWLAVVFVVVVYYVAQYLGALVISIYPALHHWSATQTNGWINSSVWGQFFYVLIAESLTLGSVYLFLKSRKRRLSDIGLVRPKLTDPVWGLAMLPLYFVSYYVIVAVVHSLVPELNVTQQQQIGFTNVSGLGNLVLTFISLVLLPPIVEEILVRGFLYTSLKSKLPQITAALVASLIFASGHLQAGSGAPLLWIAFLDTFTLSLFLIYLREKTHSLYASMTLHGLKNFIAFMSIFIFHLK